MHGGIELTRYLIVWWRNNQSTALTNLGRIVGSWLTTCVLHTYEPAPSITQLLERRGRELSGATAASSDDKYKDLPEHIRRRREEADKLIKHPAIKRLLKDDIYTEKIKAFNLVYNKQPDFIIIDTPTLEVDQNKVDMSLRKKPPGSKERELFMKRLFFNSTGYNPLEEQRAKARRGVLLVERIYTRSPWLMVREVHHIALNAAVRELTQSRSFSDAEMEQLQRVVKGVRMLIENDEMRVDPFQKSPLPQKVAMLRSMIEDELRRRQVP